MPRRSTILLLFLLVAGCVLGQFLAFFHFTLGSAIAFIVIMTLYFFWDRVKLVFKRLPLPFPPGFLFLLINCSACFLIITSAAKPTHYLNFLYLLPLLFFSEELDYKLLTPSLAVLAFFLFITIYYLQIGRAHV